MPIGSKYFKSIRTRTPIVQQRQSAILRDRHVFFNMALLLTVFLFGILYLIQINSLATKGYGMRSLEKKIIQQKKDNEKLQTRRFQGRACRFVSHSGFVVAALAAPSNLRLGRGLRSAARPFGGRCGSARGPRRVPSSSGPIPGWRHPRPASASPESRPRRCSPPPRPA